MQTELLYLYHMLNFAICIYEIINDKFNERKLVYGLVFSIAQ